METFQVSVTDICDNNCPFCISKMTYQVDHTKFNWDKLEKAAFYAQNERDIQVAKITGKWGEPLMVPERITAVITHLYDFEIELQTNAQKILSERNRWVAWAWLGLGLISISCVHWDPNKSKLIYNNQPELEFVIEFLKSFGYKVRLNCLLCKGLIDSPEDIDEFINQFPNADQISFIPIGSSKNYKTTAGANAHIWACIHKINTKEIKAIVDYLGNKYALKDLTNYSRTYMDGERSIYIADCLKLPEVKNEYRHLIYFPDGTLRYSWEDANSIVNINR